MTAAMHDVIRAHLSRLPALDDQWSARPHSRRQLIAGLLAGKVAGPAGHPMENVRRNIRMLLEGDPDKELGMSGLQDGRTFADVLWLVSEASGSAISPDREEGSVWIDPQAVLEACIESGRVLARAARSGARVLFATGHPGALDPLYVRIAHAMSTAGAKVDGTVDGLRWRDPDRDHDWQVVSWEGVMMLADDQHPRHTHSGDPMRRILASLPTPPDLVVADHGFAGAAIEQEIETVSVADVNDTALLVAKDQGRTRVVVCMDDHVPADAYWPCFQALVSEL